MLEPYIIKVEIARSQATAFSVFATQMDQWWPLDTRSMAKMAGTTTQSLAVEPSINGKIVEHGTDGSQHHWGTIREYKPHHHISMDFHMGLPPEQAGVVSLQFATVNDKRTTVTLTHSQWEKYGAMAETMYKGYSASWHHILAERYKAFVEGQSES